MKHFRLERKEVSDEGWLAVLNTSTFSDVCGQESLWLHPDELDYYHEIKADKRRCSYILGRICAKTCYQKVCNAKNPSTIHIKTGILKDPILQNQTKTTWQTGITHSNTMAAALVFPATHPLAIDVEEWDTQRTQVMKSQCDPLELNLLLDLGLSVDVSCAICWTAKEAISKALRTGRTTSFRLFELKSIHRHEDGGYAGLFSQYHQYQFRSWVIENKVLSIVLPKRTRILFTDGEPRLS